MARKQSKLATNHGKIVIEVYSHACKTERIVGSFTKMNLLKIIKIMMMLHQETAQAKPNFALKNTISVTEY